MSTFMQRQSFVLSHNGSTFIEERHQLYIMEINYLYVLKYLLVKAVLTIYTIFIITEIPFSRDCGHISL